MVMMIVVVILLILRNEESIQPKQTFQFAVQSRTIVDMNLQAIQQQRETSIRVREI